MKNALKVTLGAGWMFGGGFVAASGIITGAVVEPVVGGVVFFSGLVLLLDGIL